MIRAAALLLLLATASAAGPALEVGGPLTQRPKLHTRTFECPPVEAPRACIPPVPRPARRPGACPLPDGGTIFDARPATPLYEPGNWGVDDDVPAIPGPAAGLCLLAALAALAALRKRKS